MDALTDFVLNVMTSKYTVASLVIGVAACLWLTLFGSDDE